MPALDAVLNVGANTSILILKMARFITIIIVCILSAAVNAADKPIGIDENSEKALSEVQNLKSWNDVYRMFKRYENRFGFDDGAIAEGYSDAVGRLLSDDWKHLKDLKKLTDSDKAFERFVYKHLDVSIPDTRWRMMTDNATNKCPKSAKIICKAILKANSDIEVEIKKEREAKH